MIIYIEQQEFFNHWTIGLNIWGGGYICLFITLHHLQAQVHFGRGGGGKNIQIIYKAKFKIDIL